jgi:hypothetical protein
MRGTIIAVTRMRTKTGAYEDVGVWGEGGGDVYVHGDVGEFGGELGGGGGCDEEGCEGELHLGGCGGGKVE